MQFLESPDIFDWNYPPANVVIYTQNLHFRRIDSVGPSGRGYRERHVGRLPEHQQRATQQPCPGTESFGQDQTKTDFPRAQTESADTTSGRLGTDA